MRWRWACHRSTGSRNNGQCRMWIPSVLARSARCSGWTALPETPSPTATPHSRWYVLSMNLIAFDPSVDLDVCPRTRHLPLHPTQETPNFSRAINRFQREDPTFRVHVDSESQEVGTTTPTRYDADWNRRLFPAWANCILTSTWNA